MLKEKFIRLLSLGLLMEHHVHNELVVSLQLRYNIHHGMLVTSPTSHFYILKTTLQLLTSVKIKQYNLNCLK